MTEQKQKETIEEIINITRKNIINSYCFLYLHKNSKRLKMVKNFYNDKITEEEVDNLVEQVKKDIANEIWRCETLIKEKEKIEQEMLKDKKIAQCLK